MSTVVALDIGSSALAGAEVKDGFTLTKAHVEDLPEGLVVDGEVAEPVDLANRIKSFWKASKFNGRSVRLGVANQRYVHYRKFMPSRQSPAGVIDRAEIERRIAVSIKEAGRVRTTPKKKTRG